VVFLLGSGKDMSTGEIIKKRGAPRFELFNRFALFNRFSDLNIYRELPRFENSRNVEMRWQGSF
jgi:hypothetical protein